jgi:carbonic anhydrase
MTAQKSLSLLKEGNIRFSSGRAERPHQDESRRIFLDDNGQNPFAAVLSCSDSRVPVEIIFDRGKGDIFVVRTAGNLDGEGETGSLEYAVEHLNVPLIVILGHTRCGAVSAVVDRCEAHGRIKSIACRIAATLEETQQLEPRLNHSELIDACSRANVRKVVEHLRFESDIIREAVEKGSLKVVSAYYDIRSGVVEWLDS